MVASMFATEDVMKKHGIGIGDDLAMVGLFVRHVGVQRNMPIVRTGILAAIPTEPLRDSTTGLDYWAYIAEIRSIGGLSGSPVFVILAPGRTHDNEMRLDRYGFLLGIVRGHWDYDNNEILSVVDSKKTSINMGMAVVTPVDALWALLSSPQQLARRAEWEDKHHSDNAATVDTRGTAE